MSDCDHWEKKVFWRKVEHFITGEMEDELVEEWISLTVDIDIYSFRCKRCGKIEKYCGLKKYEAIRNTEISGF